MAKKYFFGFTLVELMIVVAIIAILAALIVSFYTGQVFKGNDAKRKADINRIKIAVEEYEKDHNCYPLADTMQECGTNSNIPIHPYLNDVPCDPITHSYYVYETDGSPSCPVWFRLYAILQNTQDASIIAGIGPGKIYNYVQSSENAPAVVAGSGGTSAPTSPPGFNLGKDGCFSGHCEQVSLHYNKECDPNYDPGNNCFGFCTDSNGLPAHECVPIP